MFYSTVYMYFLSLSGLNVDYPSFQPFDFDEGSSVEHLDSDTTVSLRH